MPSARLIVQWWQQHALLTQWEEINFRTLRSESVMKIFITEKKTGYHIALIDPSILIDGQPLVLKSGSAFDRAGALNCAQFISDEVQSIAQENNEQLSEIPIVEVNPLSL